MNQKLARTVAAVAVSPAFAQPVEWPVIDGGNGHHYEVIVPVAEITWIEARQQAASRTWDGRIGHLLTVTSDAETQFIVNAFGQQSLGCFLGGEQQDASSAPAEGWTWVTGEPWSYTNWSPNEPGDQATGGEDALVFKGLPNGSFPPGEWNDIPKNIPRRGFIVEYSRLTLCIADLAAPFGELTFADISQFLGAFILQQPEADLAEPSGLWTFADISAFLTAFAAGCP